MIYWRLNKVLVICALIYMVGCARFEREGELLRFLNTELNISIDTIKDLKVFILQDKICGACTDSILQFIISLEPKNNLIVLSDMNKKVLNQVTSRFDTSQVYIDRNDLVGRYGMRYAQDLVVVLSRGKVRYWSFIKEERLEKIRKNL
jgi:hypothetical protein